MAKPRIVFVALFIMLCGMAPLLNALSNRRLTAIHGADIVQLVAVGLLFGFACGLLVGARGFGKKGRVALDG
jgi:hypothetical protein